MTSGPDKSSRRLPNWITSWLEYSSVLSSPLIFRRWAAIGILASVMERKVWSRTKGANLYPNLYTILVGPPGVGKSAILSHSERILRAVPDIYVAPSSLTTASMIDTLELSKRKIIQPNKVPNFIQYNSLQVVASELGVFLPAYDPAFMNTLTKLYDGELYEERRRTGKVNHIRIDNPQLNVIGGTTPSYLNSFLPEGAWDQGFTSRTIFVYCGQAVKTPIFSEERNHDALEVIYVGLLQDLKQISQAFGKFDWAPDAAAAITAWDEDGLKPVPDHAKLTHYNTRRLAHVLKLSMIMSIARSDSLIISLEDYTTAKEFLLEIESLIPDIFNSMGVSADGKVLEDCYHFVFRSYVKDKKSIPEHRVVGFLRDRVPSHSIIKMIEIMVRSKLLILDMSTGQVAYKPGVREQ